MLTWWRISLIVGLAFAAVMFGCYRFAAWLFDEVMP